MACLETPSQVIFIFSRKKGFKFSHGKLVYFYFKKYESFKNRVSKLAPKAKKKKYQRNTEENTGVHAKLTGEHLRVRSANRPASRCKAPDVCSPWCTSVAPPTRSSLHVSTKPARAQRPPARTLKTCARRTHRGRGICVRFRSPHRPTLPESL